MKFFENSRLNNILGKLNFRIFGKFDPMNCIQNCKNAGQRNAAKCTDVSTSAVF